MRWGGLRRSNNVEDRRGMRAGGRGVALSGGGILLLIVFALLTGTDPLALLEEAGGPSASVEQGPGERGQMGAPSDQLGGFAAAVLGSTEDAWTSLFEARGARYQPPTLVLFTGAVNSACGFGAAAVGPFYCPLDGKVYLDLSFFDELARRFGAPGDFAQAYVIAHEVGHHVQNVLGVAEKVRAAQSRASEAQSNALSVRMELQADCLAGVWAHHADRTANLLEPGDLEEGLRAASAIGDDQLQRRSQGYTVPETWTHGSSDMRVRWLRRGVQSGDIEMCDTFGSETL
ncbi:MAG: neutral zinc metallopeptidase [Candidatus Binatia bacterium]